MNIIVLCFDDKVNMQAYRARHCIGPFYDYEAVYRWLDENKQNHWVSIEVEKPQMKKGLK